MARQRKYAGAGLGLLFHGEGVQHDHALHYTTHFTVVYLFLHSRTWSLSIYLLSYSIKSRFLVGPINTCLRSLNPKYVALHYVASTNMAGTSSLALVIYDPGSMKLASIVWKGSFSYRGQGRMRSLSTISWRIEIASSECYMIGCIQER